MKRYRQLEPVLISSFETAEWKHPIHNHNHFELIYIKKGKGIHHINKEILAYCSGDIFLLGPEEEHYFEIEESTHFIYLKFSERYLVQEYLGDEKGVSEMKYLINCRELRLSKFELVLADLDLIDKLFDLILGLNVAPQLNEQLIRLQVRALGKILRRNLPKMVTGDPADRNMTAIFEYIHEHIYLPDKLRAVVMADHFNISTDYIGPYFKRNAGITLRNYIRDYRISLISKRMKNGKHTLKQIAAEFGLTDESHLKKILSGK